MAGDDSFGLVEIRVRRRDEGEARHLTYWRIGALSTLLDMLGDRMWQGEAPGIEGQWCLDTDAAYFEVILGD